ncbi:DUF6538 domain-containing protein [Rhizobium sp. C4]|uniref:DUF6538 domain-containing protein n=1 Tax=Rhizobium sp. C4 TaxID=1349800 RepID=UPI002E7B7D77|nr:DUF6538 domain-containing protein [Rhizobium sp. C4]
MAVRHEVENLIRRGNIFYWRPRIPSCFLSCQSGSRLSRSLQLSDHKKAQVIARRLNLRLGELKQRPKEVSRTSESGPNVTVVRAMSARWNTILKRAGPTNCSHNLERAI